MTIAWERNNQRTMNITPGTINITKPNTTNIPSRIEADRRHERSGPDRCVRFANSDRAIQIAMRNCLGEGAGHESAEDQAEQEIPPVQESRSRSRIPVKDIVGIRGCACIDQDV